MPSLLSREVFKVWARSFHELILEVSSVSREGLHMIVLVSLVVLLGDFLVSTTFHMVHPTPTSSFLNDVFDGSRIKAATHMRTCIGAVL